MNNLLFNKNRLQQQRCRREFLKDLAKGGVSTSVLSASIASPAMLWGRAALAQNNVPRRFICVFVSNGAIKEMWNPIGSETNFTLPEMTAPLTPVKDRVAFFKNVNMRNGGHGNTYKCLGEDTLTTLDFHMGDIIGQDTPYSSMRLGVVSQGPSGLSRFNRQKVAYEDNPITAFQSVFGSGGDSDLALRQDKSILDANLEVLRKLEARLGGDERIRLQQHVASVEKLERRLSSGGDGPADCKEPVWNAGGFNETPTDTHFTAVSNLQMDLAILAMECDMTRVVSIMLSDSQAQINVPEVNSPSTYHGGIHSSFTERFVWYRQYFSERFKYLIDGLAAARDIDGSSLLDNTVIMFCSDMGDGRGHTGTNAPWLLAGSCQGQLREGINIDLAGAEYDAIPNTASIAMGLDITHPEYPFARKDYLSQVLTS